jgi:methionyl-tRNA formyltransferase
MAMSEEMDAGDVLLVRTTPIGPDDTGGSLTERLSQLGATALVDAIAGIKSGAVRPVPQPADGITFAPRIEREHTRLAFDRAAVALERAVRAFAPEPGAFTTLDGATLKVFAAEVRAGRGEPGRVVEAGPGGLVVGTADGTLALLEVQPQGQRRMPIAAFLAGRRMAAGSSLGT